MKVAACNAGDQDVLVQPVLARETDAPRMGHPPDRAGNDEARIDRLRNAANASTRRSWRLFAATRPTKRTFGWPSPICRSRSGWEAGSTSRLTGEQQCPARRNRRTPTRGRCRRIARTGSCASPKAPRARRAAADRPRPNPTNSAGVMLGRWPLGSRMPDRGGCDLSAD